MALLRPYVMQASGADTPFQYSAAEFRTAIQALWHQEGIAAPDVVFGALRVTQRAAGANFSVDVAAGRGAVFGDDAVVQGIYHVESTAVENRTVPSPPGAGSRTHRVVARVRDKAHNASWPDGTYDWVLELLEDTGTGTPAIPASAIGLARVSVAAGQSSVTNAHIIDDRLSGALITSKFPMVGADSGRPPNGFDGEVIFRTDKGAFELCVGGSWFEMTRRDGGGTAWSTYTPSITGTTSNPNLGASPTRVGRYVREGRRVHVQVIIKFGASGVAAGSGFYEITLPVVARTQSPGRQSIGSAYAWDNSGTDFSDGIAFLDTGVNNRVRLSIDSTVVANNWPTTWAINDEVGFSVTYEAAS